MSQVYNFSAGPAMLPKQVLQVMQDELLEYGSAKASVMEISHRGADFMALAQKSEQDLRDLMNIPDNYKVLFMQGGASSQFSMVPINLLRGKTKANYAHTGHWSKKAIAEAQRYCGVNICTDSSDNKYTNIADFEHWHIDEDGAYLHYTPNETIAGLEFDYTPEAGMLLVADMSSSILSREIDVSKYGVIYAGAQKNIGIAGLTIVIVREDLMGNVVKNQPILFDYATQANNDSMYNTPSTYPWYVASRVFEWLKEQGGLSAIAKINERKAKTLYEAIDGSDFYSNPVAKKYRSWMNVPFLLANEDLNSLFLEKAANNGLITLKGHRSVGGMRASIYNAMPQKGVDQLVAFMQDFERENG
ncbi:3-phosphoserine/phosphohydroxythreonine transaminase [bacterium endosymbiont of Bathymodiolus sp. 5 South]|jgi:phosphoserine aminotransferase|uniref:3-phosphoserine/phosphohydroxythreonine transaminase n=1 Tax=bacterium endosymbiont of Bathymodiolus sp. 5 South TaxID=1181670 RepID=UPI0010B65489|nr:3-phosphoserine/phosphohydroxythreonine transaminase [bacterium endosymbiont of Bathymodiolus sp. 5 South]VVH59458.1 Phosphoserine aminotransferase (EC [uncultured Gammaproteobacteria bacterium]SHN89491.1 Phosphoserine aminotransferase [bacterium endosymbiont of Bathymodiolus sp. 5 South]SSC07546.1 Phosphoserine aminotransferase [bacterium endosymbiont of Bathymodiolus sp. 5 South]VVH61411.1 Phosphoserine aminotransferase (EC [uncultured Gammaproteobacteria bacterium]VVM25818.1 Phosphoserin